MSAQRKRTRRPVFVIQLVKIVRSLFREARTLVLVPALAILLAAVSYWGWHAAHRHGLRGAEYRLDTRNIELNDPPSWITAGAIKDAVVRDASLDQPLSILDPGLTERIALAFAAHPWVAEVRQVEKFHPARVTVHLIYREPAAVVVDNQQLIPVDKMGVQLPVEDFPPSQLKSFPQIFGISYRRRGQAGMPWGDPRVEGAAHIASVVGPVWRQLDLVGIVPSDQPVYGNHVFNYELVTFDGTRIAWGPQFLEAEKDQPSATEKLAQIKEYVETFGTLKGFRLPATVVPTSPGRTARSPQHEPSR